jgi:hypothetical protein
VARQFCGTTIMWRDNFVAQFLNWNWRWSSWTKCCMYVVEWYYVEVGSPWQTRKREDDFFLNTLAGFDLTTHRSGLLGGRGRRYYNVYLAAKERVGYLVQLACKSALVQVPGFHFIKFSQFLTHKFKL